MCYFNAILHTENNTPTMKDLNRYVKKYASDWKDIGLELGLELNALGIIGTNNKQNVVDCLQVMLDMWLKSSRNTTWHELEVALTNVNRQKLGLDPVDELYGRYMQNDFYVSICSIGQDVTQVKKTKLGINAHLICDRLQHA